jgi:hypothetical protein
LRRLLLAATFAPMKTRRDRRATVRLASPLLSELEQAANEDHRTVADTIRQVLIKWAAERLVKRADTTAQAA